MTSTIRQLSVIGTIHRDPQGEATLVSLLEVLQPSMICVEVAPAAIEYRRLRTRPLLFRLDRILSRLAKEEDRSLAELAELPVIRDIHQLLAVPYEYRAACRYAAPLGIPVEMIDLDQVSLMKLRRVDPGLINYRNIRTLVRLDPPTTAPQAEGDYSTARNLLANTASERLREAFLTNKRGEEGIGPRDAFMEEKIRRLLRTRSPRHLVHIGGWVHLIDDPRGETLWSRLADLQPSRYLADRHASP